MELTNNTSKEEIEQLKEYSEDFDSLKKVLGDIRIFLGEPRLLSHFPEDKAKMISRNVYTINIKRGDIKISFKFGDSIFNTEERKSPTMYDILCCMGADYSCPDSFEDFCDEYGCDRDSLMDKKTFDKSKRQSQKLKTIFTDKEIEAFPS